MSMVLPLCPRCHALFINNFNVADAILICREAEIIQRVKEYYSSNDSISLCPCCLGCLQGDVFDKVADDIGREITKRGWKDLKVAILVELPPVLEVSRLAVRAVMMQSVEKRKDLLFPTFVNVFQRIIGLLLCNRGFSVVDDAVSGKQVKVVLKASIASQESFCKAILSNYQHKKKRRKLGVSAFTMDEHEVTRTDADGVASHLKTFTLSDICELQAKMISFTTNPESMQCKARLQTHVSSFPIYLLGRYRKLARDVPQSPWTLGALGTLGEVGNESANREEQRKGRNSVEEIIGDAVKGVVHASQCRIHACGREDIDVRCLGNGRPFVLEVIDADILPEDIHLQTIMGNIAARHGLNKEGDVEVVKLQLASKSVWEGMQSAAEEKKKAYVCVVWSASKVTSEVLKKIEALTAPSACSIDEDGRPCLEISQKTPLRVLHRRSLIDRKRFIYDIETVMLNDHYFLLSLVTSAGTYVKEFVHGDLGRTVPNISSLLQCPSDILQLDVTWLFDDFEGGGERALMCNEEGRDDRENGNTMSWIEMNKMPLAATNIESKNSY